MEPINEEDKERMAEMERVKTEQIDKMTAKVAKCEEKIKRFELEITELEKEKITCEAEIKKHQFSEKKHNTEIKNRNNKKKEQAKEIKNLRGDIKKAKDKLAEIKDKETKTADKLSELQFQKQSMKPEEVEAEYDGQLNEIERKIIVAATDREKANLNDKKLEVSKERASAYTNRQNALDNQISSTQVDLNDFPRAINEANAHINTLKARKREVKNTVLDEPEEIMPLLIDEKLQVSEFTAKNNKIKDNIKFKKNKIQKYKDKAKRNNSDIQSLRATGKITRSTCCEVF